MRILTLSLLILSIDGLRAFRCLLFNNTCRSVCPSGMHVYNTRCDRDTMSQRTCSFPYIYSLGHTCGWSRCDCNGELVLEETTALCVELVNCDLIRESRRRGRGRGRRPPRTRRPKIKEDDVFYDMM